MTSRAEVERFAATCRGNLVTHLIDAGAQIDDRLVRDAVWHWRTRCHGRQCFGCRTSFVGGTKVGAFLVATPAGNATTASISGLCAKCWADLPDDAIEAAALRLLTARLAAPAMPDKTSPRQQGRNGGAARGALRHRRSATADDRAPGVLPGHRARRDREDRKRLRQGPESTRRHAARGRVALPMARGQHPMDAQAPHLPWPTAGAPPHRAVLSHEPVGGS
jgi:hypothetical protein